MNLADFKQQFSDLDFSDVGSWPMLVKIVAVILVCLGVLGAGFWFDTRTQLEDLKAAQNKEQELRTAFEAKQHKAANLQPYRDQMEEMKRSFGTMLRQLPSRTEIAELLVDVSQTGLANGLEFELFKPQAESPAEFYAELPIKIKVAGDYHEFGNFASGVAVLPRIVTLHDITIMPAKDNEGSSNLIMEATAKTYRYLEEGAQ